MKYLIEMTREQKINFIKLVQSGVSRERAEIIATIPQKLIFVNGISHEAPGMTFEQAAEFELECRKLDIEIQLINLRIEENDAPCESEAIPPKYSQRQINFREEIVHRDIGEISAPESVSPPEPVTTLPTARKRTTGHKTKPVEQEQPKPTPLNDWFGSETLDSEAIPRKYRQRRISFRIPL